MINKFLLALTNLPFYLSIVPPLFFTLFIVTDIKENLIKNKHIILFLIARILISLYFNNGDLFIKKDYLIASLLISLIFIIPAIITNHKCGGDIKLLAVMGLWYGTTLMIFILGISLIISTLSILIRKIDKRTRIPFAPALGLIVYILPILKILYIV